MIVFTLLDTIIIAVFCVIGLLYGVAFVFGLLATLIEKVKAANKVKQ